MTNNRHNALLLLIACLLVGVPALCVAQVDAPLPAGVRAAWEMDRAFRQTTPTRERICINGLWRWQPGDAAPDRVPQEGWGYFKVPGCWPGITDYIQKDSQTLYFHPAWKALKLADVQSAWYQREIEIPANWAERKISLNAEYVNSLAMVYLDGKKVGEIRFPAGPLDLPNAAPGKKYTLSLYVVALPMKGVMLSYTDSAAAREVKGSVPRRGLCGDLFLTGVPAGPRIDELAIDTSVRRGEIGFNTAISDLPAEGSFTLRARIMDKTHQVAEFNSNVFKAGDVAGGRFRFSARWKPDRLWDIDTPENQYSAQLSLLDASGKIIDTSFDAQFGFRELWIDGRDFILNGSRIFLSAVPFDNASIGAGSANYAAARETFQRLKNIGINFVYTHNYDCEPGSHLSLEEILRAADDVGILVAVTQPHFSNYDWKALDADASNGYARHAAFYARVAGNHPSVTFYSTSHNATGYDEDMDPDLIDGIHDRREQWSAHNLQLSARVEKIIRALDPTRIVYHHAGGNNGAMHSINFYPNFAPIQELSDWFQHWATTGVKPVFLCEYGAPFTWDWAMYRGWYNGHREFGSAAVPWEFCLAEWNSQFLGDKAFDISDLEKANLRWEAKQFRAGSAWHRWDYPTEMGSPRFADRHKVLAMYIGDNWRAYRTWGVSGISPWEYGHFWSLRDGVNRARVELPVDWEKLQRPGFSPDYIDQRVDRMDTAYEAADWIPTADRKTLLANNRPVLAYIAGKPGAFTEKGHNYLAGQTVQKQLIVINNSRQTLALQCEWSLNGPRPIGGQTQVSISTGNQARIPLEFELPKTLAPGAYQIKISVRFGRDGQQADSFEIDVLPQAPAGKLAAKIALFDPQGQTATILKKLGIAFQAVSADADLSQYDILIIGKFALNLLDPAPDVSRVRDGLKVIVFEQHTNALEQRLGFRVEEYGLRNVFERIPDHPAFAGLGPENLRDWRGPDTTVSDRLDFEVVPMHGPMVKWCDIPVSRVWRCGTRGSVASVLIEKPACGDFLPIADGGFSLQFTPLMEFRQGKGMVLFCQLDVSDRAAGEKISEDDPAAARVFTNLLRYADTWTPHPTRKAIYVGEAAGKKYLESMGLSLADYGDGEIDPGAVLIAGPGASADASPKATAVEKFLAAGGRLLAIALDQKEADALLPVKISIKQAEHINATFDAPLVQSPLAGIGPADVYNRGPKQMPLMASGANIVGDGVLAFTTPGANNSSVIFCQMAPWQIDPKDEPNLRRTFRRSSFLLARLLANMGVSGRTHLLENFRTPLKAGNSEKRWLDGLYLDTPEEWDDPYRFFRW